MSIQALATRAGYSPKNEPSIASTYSACVTQTCPAWKACPRCRKGRKYSNTACRSAKKDATKCGMNLVADGHPSRVKGSQCSQPGLTESLQMQGDCALYRWKKTSRSTWITSCIIGSNHLETRTIHSRKKMEFHTDCSTKLIKQVTQIGAGTYHCES